MHSFRKLLWTCALAGASTMAHAAVATGTGFVITRQGHIATNYHVVDGGKKISVKDSADRRFDAWVVLTDPNNDLAILQIDDTSHPALPIKSSASMKKGAPVFTLGFPNPGTQGIESKVTEGIISSLSSFRGRPNSFQISVPIQPGNSGGPLLDFTGGVVGLTTAKLSADYMLEIGGQLPENVNYAVKSNYLMELVRTNENIGSKITLSTSEKSLPLPSLVAAAEKSVMFIQVELADPQPKDAVNSAKKPDNRGAEPKYLADALAVDYYDRGLVAYKAGKYAEALVYFGESASRGHKDAQYYLGDIYYNGRGIGVNYPEALFWYIKSAAQALPGSQAMVCSMHRKGLGTEKNDTEAAKWCKLAAENGHSWAQLEIGILYATGTGIAKDDTKAFEWTKKAVDARQRYAQYYLAHLYYKGQGVSRDYTEAFRLLSRSAEEGLAEAQSMLGFMYFNGYGVGLDHGKAFEWFKKSADQADSMGQYNVGLSYEYGRGVPRDYGKAIDWYQKSVAQGQELAKTQLQALLEKQKNSPPAVPIGSIVDINPDFGYAIVKTNAPTPENTPLYFNISGEKIFAKAGRQADGRLSILMERAYLKSNLIGSNVYVKDW